MKSVRVNLSQKKKPRRILRVMIASLEVDDDYEIEPGVHEVPGTWLEFETDLLEMSFRQYQPGESWTTIFTNGRLGKVNELRAFSMWANEILLNVLALMTDLKIITFLEAVFHRGEKVRAEAIGRGIKEKYEKKEIHEINYRTEAHIKANGSYPFSVN